MVVETKNKKQTKKKNHIRQAASESHNFFSSLKKGRANRKSNSLIRRKQFRWNQTVKKRESARDRKAAKNARRGPTGGLLPH